MNFKIIVEGISQDTKKILVYDSSEVHQQPESSTMTELRTVFALGEWDLLRKLSGVGQFCILLGCWLSRCAHLLNLMKLFASDICAFFNCLTSASIKKQILVKTHIHSLSAEQAGVWWKFQ